MEGGVQGQRVGIMHVKATGTEPLDMDLPMANDKQIVFGDLDVGVDAPSDKCTGCSYGISLRVSAHDFKGPGAYDLPVIPFAINQPGAPMQSLSMAQNWKTYDKVPMDILNAIQYAAQGKAPPAP